MISAAGANHRECGRTPIRFPVPALGSTVIDIVVPSDPASFNKMGSPPAPEMVIDAVVPFAHEVQEIFAIQTAHSSNPRQTISRYFSFSCNPDSCQNTVFITRK
jgi:hypothetical protein